MVLKRIIMKYFVLCAALYFCFITGLLAQNTDKKQNQPQENSKVTREYDEQGNLIKFDSVYSYSWSGDSTMIKHFSPEDMTKMFGGAFDFFNDSTIHNHSFFGDFDQLFADPFGPFDDKQDSIFFKQFRGDHHLQQFENDSIAFNFRNFDDTFGDFFDEPEDSTASKKRDDFAGKSRSRSMDELMQMFQQQFKEMEKRHKQFFEENKNMRKQEEF